MSKDILNTGYHLTDIDDLKKIMDYSKNQGDFIRKLQEAYSDIIVDKFSNPALLADSTFSDEKSLATSIFLALRSRKGLESLIFSCGDFSGKTRQVRILSSLDDSSRQDLANVIAKEFVSSPRAIGFTLKFLFGKDQKPTRYYFELIESTEDTRDTLLNRSKNELKQALTFIEENKKEVQNEAERYRQMIAEEEKLKAASPWKPSYIAITSH